MGKDSCPIFLNTLLPPLRMPLLRFVRSCFSLSSTSSRRSVPSPPLPSLNRSTPHPDASLLRRLRSIHFFLVAGLGNPCVLHSRVRVGFIRGPVHFGRIGRRYLFPLTEGCVVRGNCTVSIPSVDTRCGIDHTDVCMESGRLLCLLFTADGA